MKFRAGKYYIGDPCYVIKDDEWMPLLEKSDYFGTETLGMWGGEWKGFRMFAASTAWGDGYYIDNKGRGYAVDAGLIGIVPYEYITEFGSIGGGQVIEFENDFEVHAIDGVFYFGDIIIDTVGDEEVEEDYCFHCGRKVDIDDVCWYCEEEECLQYFK